MPALEKSDNTLASIYSLYTDEVLEGLQVNYKVYSEILNDFNKELVKTLLYDSAEVKFPCNLGSLRVRKRKINLKKPNKLSPDWKATKDLWEENEEAKLNKQLVYHLNDHRNGYKYKLYWDKSIARVKNKTVYYFKPARDLSRELAYILKNEFEIDYYL